jgi:hypothetical protein
MKMRLVVEKENRNIERNKERNGRERESGKK